MSPFLAIAEGLDLGVGLTGAVMPALAEELFLSDEDGSDHGIGGSVAQGTAGQAEGLAHPEIVV